MDTVKIKSKNVKMIAHRGLSSMEKENTCPAFVAAGNRSYFGIETDVHTSKDGKYIIFHDETTDRVTFGKHKINIEENNFSAYSDIILPDIDGSTDRQDIRIPLLIEYVKICKKYGKICVLEVKNPFSESEIEGLVKEIKAADYIENVIFISFDMGNCIMLRKLLPQNDIQWLTEEVITDKMIKTLVENKLDIDIHYERLTKNDVKMLHANGIKVNCWTCDNKYAAEQLVKFGVDYITTNKLE